MPKMRGTIDTRLIGTVVSNIRWAMSTKVTGSSLPKMGGTTYASAIETSVLKMRGAMETEVRGAYVTKMKGTISSREKVLP